MFDVVIVDEASQAGLEATFLQYLAPRMVVIGDDKQVSPTAVGVDQQQLRDLAGQYLGDDPYRSAWQDPQRSLFDEAKMRYRGLLTLTEHRRCVPEIIGFSNRVAYEPDGIRLVPVRQYGADRLEPIRAVFVGGTTEARRQGQPGRGRGDRRAAGEVPRRPALRRQDVRRDLPARRRAGEGDRTSAAGTRRAGGLGRAQAPVRRLGGLPGRRARRDVPVDGRRRRRPAACR